MKNILVIDTETTGLDLAKSEIWEVAWAIIDPTLLPIHMFTSFLTTEAPLPKEILDICHVPQEHITNYGRDPRDIYELLMGDCALYSVSHICGHNIKAFDIPLLQSNMERSGIHDSWKFFKGLAPIDTMTDLPMEYPTKKLSYLSAELGFLNPFAHRALFDVLTCIKILQKFDLEEVLVLSKSPEIEIKAMVSYEKKDLASKRGFRWDGVRKIWSKKIKTIHLSREQAQMDFDVKVI